MQEIGMEEARVDGEEFWGQRRVMRLLLLLFGN
jgi:hypothetical protein